MSDKYRELAMEKWLRLIGQVSGAATLEVSL